jgi:hypothetical protein
MAYPYYVSKLIAKTELPARAKLSERQNQTKRNSGSFFQFSALYVFGI